MEGDRSTSASGGSNFIISRAKMTDKLYYTHVQICAHGRASLVEYPRSA